MSRYECEWRAPIPGAPMAAPPSARLLAESVDDVIALLDPDGRIAYVNHACTRHLGHAVAELTGRDVRSLVHPRELEAVEAALEWARARPGQTGTICCWVCRAGSGHRVMEIRGALDTTLPGGPGIVLMARDVTTQHLQERLQRWWSEILRPGCFELEYVLDRICVALMAGPELSAAFVARCDPDGRLDVRARGGHIVPAGAVMPECVVQVLRTGRLAQCKEGGWGSGPTIGWRGTWSVLPLKARDGFEGVLAMRPAIGSELDTAALALIEHFCVQVGLVLDRIAQDARLSLLGRALTAAANGIFITDRDAVIELVNDAFVALSGYAREELIGRTPRLLHSGVHGHEYYRALKAAVHAGEPWSGEITNRRRDGSLYVAQQTITPILDVDGTVRHFIAIQQDVTEHKRLEREIHDLANCVELSRQDVREQIAREIHDELGGSLVSLRHDIEWLLQRADDEPIRERLRIMHGLAVHSLASARQIVAGLRPTVVEDLGLADAICWLANEFKQHHELDVTVDVGPDLACVPQRLGAETYRVVQECLNNVVKHAQASRVRIRGAVNECLLVFEVVDDGVGVTGVLPASGTRGMMERASLLGGYVEIGPAAGGGTSVRLVVPLSNGEEES